MKTRLLVGLMVAGLLAAMLPGVAAAAKPAKGDVHIDSEMTFVLPDYFPNFGDFEASGDAVDAGILCPDGEVLDTFAKSVGSGASGKLQITVVKAFTCADGSGTFFVKLQIHNYGDFERFSWVVKGGSGDYERLRGSGRGYSDDFSADGNTNHYDGFVID